MNKQTIYKKNQAITEKFRKRFSNMKKEKPTVKDIRNELIVRIQQKTGKSKEEILKEIHRFMD